MNSYSQSAMNAAAGSNGQPQRSMGLSGDSSPQMYSQMLANHHRQSMGQQNPQANGGQGQGSNLANP